MANLLLVFLTDLSCAAALTPTDGNVTVSEVSFHVIAWENAVVASCFIYSVSMLDCKQLVLLGVDTDGSVSIELNISSSNLSDSNTTEHSYWSFNFIHTSIQRHTGIVINYCTTTLYSLIPCMQHVLYVHVHCTITQNTCPMLDNSWNTRASVV